MEDGTYLVKSDGSIVNYGERWNYGYFVADGSKGVKLLSSDFNNTLEDALLDVSMRSANALVGVWTSYDGIVYIDPTEHVADTETALKLARDRGELAIWDAFKSECVYL